MQYYGNGDSKSFEKVQHIYPGEQVIKFECTGHYQKRVGNRLRKLRARTKGLGGGYKVRKVPDDEKPGELGKVKEKKKKAKSRLTDSVIDKLQNYFGIALRSKVTDVKEMQNAILPSLSHVASSEDCDYQTYCPKTSDSWCHGLLIEYGPICHIVKLRISMIRPYHFVSSIRNYLECFEIFTQILGEIWTNLLYYARLYYN